MLYISKGYDSRMTLIACHYINYYCNILLLNVRSYEVTIQYVYIVIGMLLACKMPLFAKCYCMLLYLFRL